MFAKQKCKNSKDIAIICPFEDKVLAFYIYSFAMAWQQIVSFTFFAIIAQMANFHILDIMTEMLDFRYSHHDGKIEQLPAFCHSCHFTMLHLILKGFSLLRPFSTELKICITFSTLTNAVIHPSIEENFPLFEQM